MELTAGQARHTRYACYFAYLAMSSIFSLPPLLFHTFRTMYGISYTMLGTPVLINFCPRLTVDLIFTFFTKYFNPHKTVHIMPCLTTLGLAVYAIVPTLFPQMHMSALSWVPSSSRLLQDFVRSCCPRRLRYAQTQLYVC